MTRTARLLPAVLAALALAAPAAAKEGVQALVTTPVPADARAGETLRVAWTLTFADEGTRRPFNAVGVFVLLRSAAGGEPTRGFATPTAHTDGRYDAEVVVPEGGIAAVEIGLRGTTDVYFPLRNDALVAGEGGAGAPAPPAWLLAPLALAALALAYALRRRPFVRARPAFRPRART